MQVSGPISHCVFVFNTCTLTFTKFVSALPQIGGHALERTMLQVTVLLILCALLAGTIGISVSLLQTSRTISNVGTVGGIGVGIYMDQNCATPATSISWGNLSPGSSKTVTLYVRNEGSIVATLSMATNNWNPSECQCVPHSELELRWSNARSQSSAASDSDPDCFVNCHWNKQLQLRHRHNCPGLITRDLIRMFFLMKSKYLQETQTIE
jgi:hypothetical protein